MKSKILLAVALLLAISTTSVWAADSSEKTNQKTGSYTNEDVWAAYEGFNNTLLDRINISIKRLRPMNRR